MSTGDRHFLDVTDPHVLDVTVGSDRAAYPYDDVRAYLLVTVHRDFGDLAHLGEPPVDAILLLDLGASMDAPDRYPLLRRAVETFLDSLPDTDRFSIIGFTDTSERLIPLTSAAELRDRRSEVLSSMDRSAFKSSGRTLMAPALVRAFEDLWRGARPGAVRRVYCLTDGGLDDTEDCEKLLRAHGASIEVHVYGFGETFDVPQFTRITSGCPWGVVHSSRDPGDVVSTFQHLARNTSDRPVQRLKVEPRFASNIVCGDVFQYDPREDLLGPIADAHPELNLDALGSHREGSFLFEVRLPAVSEPGRTLVGSVRLLYRVGARGQIYVDVVELQVQRTSELGNANQRVCLKRDILCGMRDNDARARIAVCKARLTLYRLERRDPQLIADIQTTLDSLLHPGAPSPPLPSPPSEPPPSHPISEPPPSNLPPGPLSSRPQSLFMHRPSTLPPPPRLPRQPNSAPRSSPPALPPPPRPPLQPPSAPTSSTASLAPPSAPTSSPPAQGPSSLSSLNKAIMALDKVKAKLAAVERQRSEPIAIIGMACRFPGDADTPETFFRLLEAGMNAVSEVPADRWSFDAAGDSADPARQGARWGAFLKQIARFDSSFFGISPPEAIRLDPQQRLLLELTWEALERGGHSPARLVGSPTGVFIGVASADYMLLSIGAPVETWDPHLAMGTSRSFAAGRIASTLGLQGPAMAVDTACSSSLVATHLACQSLRSGESTLAIVGGVNLMLSPVTTEIAALTRALAPDGRCKAFDAQADGHVRGEGCGVLILKLLSDAQRDGDPILALIRGSAVNQDGRRAGPTAPNVLSQQMMLRQALASARVAAEEIGYIEAHGAGASLGDPIELEALRAVLGKPRANGATCVLGAVKTNIGHLEAAAGVAGLIKAVMALQHEIIPKNLHFQALNPRISLVGTPFVIPTENLPWTRGQRPRFAGVSAFGVSGTNAHVILEEAPSNTVEDAPDREASSYLLPVSARSVDALQALSGSYAEMLAGVDGAPLCDIVHTASMRRMHHEHRLAVTGRTREELAAELTAFARSGTTDAAQDSAGASMHPKVVFVFSGQGSQWSGMGLRLLAEEPVFRAKLEHCDHVLRQRMSWSLVDELRAPEERSRLGESDVAQPALFAIQVCLVELLKFWGIRPDAVIGHGVGEIAAAHVAGALSLEHATHLVSWRGRVLRKATGLGKMAWVALPAEAAAKAIAGRESEVAIAAVNDPDSVVLSGDPAALDDILSRLSEAGIACRQLKVNYAFNSPQMDQVAKELLGVKRVEPTRTTIPFYSTVTGSVLEGEALDLSYWARNLREPVQLARAMKSASSDGHRIYLEIGPHPVLSLNLERCLADEPKEGHVVHTLRRQTDERLAMLEALGKLYVRGRDVDWKAVHGAGGRCVPLPAYPWQRQRFWYSDTSGGRLDPQ